MSNQEPALDDGIVTTKIVAWSSGISWSDGRPPWDCPHKHGSQDEAYQCGVDEKAFGLVGLGMRLRVFRKTAGIGFEDAAFKLDLSVSTISRVETGLVVVHPVHLAAMLECYGVSEQETVEVLDQYRAARARRKQQIVDQIQAAKAQRNS